MSKNWQKLKIEVITTILNRQMTSSNLDDSAHLLFLNLQLIFVFLCYHIVVAVTFKEAIGVWTAVSNAIRVCCVH